MQNSRKMKKWLLLFALISFLIIAFVGGVNYFVDPYGMNNFKKVDKINVYKKSNTGYTFRFKTNIYRNNEFDTLLIGTSRVGVMDPEVVNKMLNGKTFNFSSSGSITEIQKDLFFYGVKNQKIKNVIYGIDFLSLNGSLILKERFKEFYAVQDDLKNNRTIYNWDMYFNWDTLWSSIEVVHSNYSGVTKEKHRYRFQDGMRDYVDFIAEEQEGTFDFEKHLKHSLKTYFPKTKRISGYYNYRFSDQYLLHIKKIVTYCKENNINLWVYIPPMYRDHFDALYAYGIYDEFEEFKRKLVTIVDYIDFTGHNSITDAKESFWEGSHLKKELTPLVMGRILQKDIDIPDDFGVYVTHYNIESHLTNLKNSIEFYNLETWSRDEK